ncbi:MAG: EAL domain-containing protein [Xanthobacteraceae bacterium]|jgi:diguanylate cyclase (GGDEF)-like protein
MDITSREPSAKDVRPARYLVIAVAALLGITVSVVAYVAVSNWENRLAELKLVELAKHSEQMLNSDLRSATEVLYTLRAYYNTGRAISRSEFQAFAKDLRGRLVGMRNTGWAIRVTREGRAAFEASVRAEGFPGFEIWERDSEGNRIRARDRAEYFPILYPDPVEYTSQILGFDIASEPVRADALLRARSSEIPAATPPINLITKDEPDGFMTFIPVYADGIGTSPHAHAPVGFMYGVFGTARMIENTLRAHTLPADIDIYFFDPNAAPGSRRIYWYSAPSVATPSVVPTESALLTKSHWLGQIRVADQEWGAIFTPEGDLAAAARNWEATAALTAGLMMTGLIVVYLLLSLKRTLHLEFLTHSLHDTTMELRNESAKVVNLARRDSMTGLANRATFAEYLERAFAAACFDGGCFAVICLDLDHFKDVNDTLGHPCGDRLLQITADRLKPLFGADDLIARLGGDEFAILLAHAPDVSAVIRSAEQIKSAIVQQYDLDGNEVHVSASIGISLFDRNTASSEDMMMQADLALYQAKNDGRDGFCFHSVQLDREIRERVSIAADLHAALSRNELELYYQPQVEVPSGRIVGLEALMRWNHPTRGFLMPHVFIPIAETTGAIHALGLWALEEACRQINRWQADGIVSPMVAINISAAHFRSASPLDRELRETLARYGVDPGCIEIELTEFALVESTKANRDMIHRVRELGVSIAIDDFGTGYSSLEYLQTYRVNRLKIAQQFMPEVAIKSGSAAIVRAVLVLARELGLESIAEGVETAEQLAFLLSAGCHYVQGYYFSPPVSATEATALLRRGVIAREPVTRSAVALRRTAR